MYVYNSTANERMTKHRVRNILSEENINGPLDESTLLVKSCQKRSLTMLNPSALETRVSNSLHIQ